MNMSFKMLSCNVGCEHLFLHKSPSMVKLGKMAAKIAHYNFEWRYDTIVMANFIHLIALQAFLTYYRNAIVIKKGKFIPKVRMQRPYVPQFVIFGQVTAELCDMLQWLMEARYDNTAKFVIVCSSTIDQECEEQSLFETLANLYIANVVFLRVNENDDQEAFTFYPVKPHKCWHNNPDKINMTYDCAKDYCYKDLYPEKFNNLYKCDFIISTFEQPPYMLLSHGKSGLEPKGGDGEILSSVANILNATLIIKTPAEGPDWGHFVNDNWTGSLGDVFNNRAHGSLCSSPLTPAKYGNFQISFPYESIDMVWAAPLPALKPSWEKLLYPFPVYLRLILLLMFIAIIFMNRFTKTKLWNNIARIVGIAPMRSNLLLYSWTLFLGISVSRLPRKLPFRMMVYSWIWYCTIIRCVYQGTLVSSLKLKAYEKKLDNFSEVLLNKYPFGGLPSLREYYSEDRHIYNNWISIGLTEIEEVLDRITRGESDLVVALNEGTVIAYLLKYNGARQLQIIPEKIVNSPTVFYFKKNSHLTYPVNKLLTITVEGGFTTRMNSRYVAHVNMLFNQMRSHTTESLKLVNFTGSHVLLILGWILSTIFFSIEMACGRK